MSQQRIQNGAGGSGTVAGPGCGYGGTNLVRTFAQLDRLLYVYSNRFNLGRVRQAENILWSFAPHDISVISNLVGGEPTLVGTSGGSDRQPAIIDVTITNVFSADRRAWP